MGTVKISGLTMKRRKLPPQVNLSSFLMFFGVGGLQADRQRKMNRRFEQEFYSFVVTASLSERLTPGRYRLDGLPDEVNKRGWLVGQDARMTTDMSEDGWTELQAWMKSTTKTVQPVRIGDLPHA